MNEKLMRLAERREHLIAQAAAQRTALVQNIEPWRKPLALADRGLSVLSYIRHHPALLVGGGALFVASRPGRAVKWLRRGWVMWRIIHRLRGR
jgi:hypothetical protein